MTSLATHPGQPAIQRPALMRRLAADSAYALLGLPLAIIAFALLVAGLSAGAGLLVLAVGLPVLSATLFVARGFAEVERGRVGAILREQPVRVRYQAPAPDAGTWRRLLTPLGDIQSWLDLIHGVLRLPVSVASFGIVTTWWVGTVGGLTYGLWDWALPHGEDNHELPELLGLQDTPGVRITFYVIIGVFFALTLPLVVRACALTEAWLAKALLMGVANLRDQAAGPTEQSATARAPQAMTEGDLSGFSA